jgi:hypothetical protein
MAVTTSITISGAISDANGLPLAGVKMNLDGTSQAVQTTSAAGAYSFGGLNAGSYSVRPSLSNCSFLPDVVNLNSLNASRVQNFSGSGAGCGGAAKVNTGALSGAFTISGKVRDASNRPVVGARINLGGSAQAIRFSDVAGGYSFHVDRGNYSLAASGACSITPSSVNFNNLAANQVRDFSATTPTCVISTMSSPSPNGAVFALRQGATQLGVTTAVLEPRSTNASAMARLQDIARELPETPRSLTIAGLPAIERRALVVIEAEQGAGEGDGRTWLSTAIATSSSVVRFETQIDADASDADVDAFFTIARNFTLDAIPALHGPALPTTPAAPRVPPATPPTIPPGLFVPTSQANNSAEVAIAASDSSHAVVYGRNPGTAPAGRVSFSLDDGNTVKNSTVALNAASSAFHLVGDPSMALGAPNASGAQAFYYSELYTSSVSPIDGRLMAIVTFRSADDGATFNQTDKVVLDCTLDSTCSIPDQAQLAADRTTQSSNGDQLYMAWRHIARDRRSNSIGISCSNDGGKSWGAVDLSSINAAGADFPRMAVAPDGSLYVLYRTGGLAYSLYVQKYESCHKGFTRVNDFPVLIKDSIGMVGDMAGLDRRAIGQYMIAPDDSDMTGQRLFVVFLDEVRVREDDVRIAESTKGGASWTVMSMPLNTSPAGHRFMPWACATNGTVHATWYDRRNSSATKSDLTTYFSRGFSDTTGSGTLTFEPEVNMSGSWGDFDDPQCLSGFGVRAISTTAEETLCTNLPPLPAQVFAGMCTPSGCTPTDEPPCGTRQPCDFRNTSNPCSTAGETCNTGSGSAKYGDYNGAACARGNLFMAWATATVPQGICAPAGSSCSTANNDCCGDAACTGSTCSPTGATCVGNGQACSSPTDCCSSNCFGGTCRPGIGIFASSCTDCNGSCLNTQTDPDNCGSCGNLCPTDPPYLCTNGVCCPAGLAYCPTAGACINQLFDNNNCGKCGHVCSGGLTCQLGNCM